MRTASLIIFSLLFFTLAARAGVVVVDESLGNIYVEDKNGNLHNAGRLVDVLRNNHSRTNAAEIRAAVKAKLEALADSNPSRAKEVLAKAESEGVVIAAGQRAKIVAAK